jgi:Skp family chaperone for outer membrane proteins
MKKTLMLASSLFLSLALGSSAYAAPDSLKIGIIDMSQILQKAPLMVTLNDSLVKKFKARQDELSTSNKALQDEANQLQYNGNTMTDADRAKLQNKILADKANVQILDASFQRDLSIAKDEAMQTFMAKFTQVINKVAKDGKYDLIEQRTNLAYVNSDLDITNDLLKQLN